ncbi:ligand-dependent nuclear receptor corepressor-like protein isoform 4-T4 [Synchiropus picturatus]
MAAVQCSRCTAERRGFRRELDSWRYKLIHCVGFESILEGIYGSMLMRDLNLFDDCEPEELDDWSPESSVSHCTFCNLPIDRDQVPSAVSPLSSPSDYSPCQPPTISESSQRAHRFLQSVFHKKDVNIGGDSSIPLIAQELMKKMIHKFALEYASKCLLDTSASVVTAGESLPSPETIDGPLDLTVSRVQVVKEKEPEPGFTYVTDGVLDLSKRNAVQAATAASNDKSSGRQCRQKDYIERSWELSESLLSKALKDIRSGKLQVQRASLLYGIPLATLKQGLDSRLEQRPGNLLKVAPGYREFKEDSPSFHAMSSMLGGDARLVLQKVAAWAEQAEIGGDAEENRDLFLSSPPVKFYQPSGLQKNLSHTFAQLRDALQLSPSPTSPSLEHPTSLRIPQVRSAPDHTRSFQADSDNKAESLRFPTVDGESSFPAKSSAPFKLRPPFLTQGCTGSANQSPQRVGQRTFSLDDSEDGATRDKDKQPRKKRGRYRQYDHELMEEAISMVMGGRMSVSKAQGVYGVPHSTLEYKVKERTGTLKNPPKKKSANFALSNSSGSGSNTSSANSGTFSAAAANRL